MRAFLHKVHDGLLSVRAVVAVGRASFPDVMKVLVELACLGKESHKDLDVLEGVLIGEKWVVGFLVLRREVVLDYLAVAGVRDRFGLF